MPIAKVGPRRVSPRCNATLQCADTRTAGAPSSGVPGPRTFMRNAPEHSTPLVALPELPMLCRTLSAHAIYCPGALLARRCGPPHLQA